MHYLQGIKIKEMNKMKKVMLVMLLFFSMHWAYGQNYTEDQLRERFDSLAKVNKGFNNAVQLNISGLPLYEFVNTLGLDNNLNISIDPSITQPISYNFHDARVKDILVFLYVNFELEYEFVGSILSVKKRVKKEIPVVVPKRELDIRYNNANEFLSVNLQNDTLWRVFNKITKLTEKNFVIQPEVREKQLNAFFQNRPYEQVLEMIAKANGLQVEKEKEGEFHISLAPQETIQEKNKTTTKDKNKKKRDHSSSSQTEDFVLEKNEKGTLDIYANNVDLIDIIKEATKESGAHYVLQTNLDGKAQLDLKGVTFEVLLGHLFRNTKYNYILSDDVFIIGESKAEGVRKAELIRMVNRTVENVMSSIPKELMNDITANEFLELNGLIVSGNERSIAELRKFLKSIDVVVPMIQIDVMLLYSQRGNSNKTGIQAGLKDKPSVTGGTVYPNYDMTLDASTINDLLSSLSGFGVLNLGKVTENFYVSLNALESNNIIEIESTPKIATLNGQKASISIGQTTYYQETQVNVQTSVTQSGTIQSKTWKSIDANLSVKIKPIVSADEQITLSITVQQNDFSGKVDPTSPPNMTTQTFESLVRVKNGEVVLLGGLDKKTNTESGSGVPLLSRLPFLKWIFGNRSKDKSKSKLHILLKPTVTY
jgi:type IV pilus assembly protein PilQ